MTGQRVRGNGVPIDDLEGVYLDGRCGLDHLGADVLRRARVTVAAQVAAAHPHPLDDLMPRLAGRTLAQSPLIAAELKHALAAFGLLPETGGTP